jgi:hypothetical protein
VTLGRQRRGRDFEHQYRRKPARCQPTTVSGFTICSARARETRYFAGASRTTDQDDSVAVWAVSSSGRLAKREDFDRNLSTALEEDMGCGNQGQEKRNQAIIISPRGTAARWHMQAVDFTLRSGNGNRQATS